MKNVKFITTPAANAFLSEQLEKSGMTVREMAGEHISRNAICKI